MDQNDPSIRSLIRDLIDEVSRLIRQELRLAQAEASEKVTQAQRGAISIIVGLLLAFAALLILLQALVMALATTMPAWLASIIVGVAVAAIAFVLVWAGQSSLRASKLKPERTARTLREDKELVMGRVR